MNGKATREIWGLRCELLGLIVVLLATLWQVSFTDWWAEQFRDWESFVQEDVGVAILRSLKDLGYIATMENKADMQRAARSIDERVTDASTKLLTESDKRRKEKSHGQAETFAQIRRALVVLGAGLLIVGKWATLSARVQASRDNDAGRRTPE